MTLENGIHGENVNQYFLVYNGKRSEMYYDADYDIRAKRYAEFIRECDKPVQPLDWYICQDCGRSNDIGVECECQQKRS